jgi:hypothetical protein
MAKLTKTAVDKELRERVLNGIYNETGELDFFKVNDRQFGVLLTDLNGHQRYVRIGAIVAEEREDMTAEELMVSEIEAYNLKQEEKAEKARKRAEKAEKDKARRKAEAEAKAKEVADNE